MSASGRQRRARTKKRPLVFALPQCKRNPLLSSLPHRHHSHSHPHRPTLQKTAALLTLLAALLLPATTRASAFTITATRTTHHDQPAIRITFDIPAEHNLYASFTVTTPDGHPLLPLSLPPPDPAPPDALEPSYSRPFHALYAAPATTQIVVEFQGCKGDMCFLPEEITLDIGPAPSTPAPITPPPPPQRPSSPACVPSLTSDLRPLTSPSPLNPEPRTLNPKTAPRRLTGACDAAAFLAFLDPSAPTPAAASAWQLFLDDPAQFYLRHGVGLSILLILLGGVLLNLTPCVLPMIPINLAIIGASGADTSRAVRFSLGLVYGLGMALVYGALGLLVVLTGSVFGALHASPVFTGAIALLFFVLALAMFDVWQLDFSRFRKGGGAVGKVRVPAVLVMGGISALLAGACVAPVLIAVLALSGSLYAQGATGALALPFLLGVGMALPWPLAAAGIAILPKPGAWMNAVKKAFGVLILLLALYYAWNTLSALRASPASAAPAADTTTAATADATAATAPADSPFHTFDFATDAPAQLDALLAAAAASGRPVLLDFGAHWCKSCHWMDATTLRDPAVLKQLQNMFAIRILADRPNRPPARDALAPFGIQGYPTYLLYPAATPAD